MTEIAFVWLLLRSGGLYLPKRARYIRDPQLSHASAPRSPRQMPAPFRQTSCWEDQMSESALLRPACA
eukprot:scaffold439_cov415-Prasinococcus_capsulatus_cf.AAC.55